MARANFGQGLLHALGNFAQGFGTTYNRSADNAWRAKKEKEAEERAQEAGQQLPRVEEKLRQAEDQIQQAERQLKAERRSRTPTQSGLSSVDSEESRQSEWKEDQPTRPGD